MYVSARDRALEVSGWIHGYPRAGFTPPVTVVGGVNTIEASGIDLTTLGHRYFAEAAAVPTSERSGRRVSEVMSALEGSRVLDIDAQAATALSALLSSGDEPVAVLRGDQVVGLIRGSDILRWIMLHQDRQAERAL